MSPMEPQPAWVFHPPASETRPVRIIGVISDTHGLLRPQALEALRGSDLILHAGDIGGLDILEEIGRIAPVRAVFGNTDWGQARDALSAREVVDLGSADGRVSETGSVGPLAYVLHDLTELDLDPEAAGIRLVITGHTHEPLVVEHGSVTFLNPGSAGPRRFSLPTTVARVTVEGESLEAEIVDLEIH